MERIVQPNTDDEKMTGLKRAAIITAVSVFTVGLAIEVTSNLAGAIEFISGN